jgi:hypothetical protein
METRKFITANIRMPVEIFEDGSYKIYTDLYKIDFSDSLDDPDLMKVCLSNTDLDLDADADSCIEDPDQPSFIEKITQILANEIKPRRNRVSTNTTFKHFFPLRKSRMRFSRKQKEPIRINSSTEDAGLLEVKTAPA